jgi:hypothetical protein
MSNGLLAEAQNNPDLMRALMASLETATVKTSADAILKKALDKSIFEKKMISILPNMKTQSPVKTPVNRPNVAKLKSLLAKRRKGENAKMSILRLKAAKKANNLPGALPQVRLADVSGDGNCFYSALINAANEQGVLELLTTCLEINSMARLTPLIQGLRNYVSANIDERARQAYRVLNNLFYEEPDTLLEIINTTFAQWHQDVLFKAIEHNSEDEFVASIKTGILKMGSWASELEVKLLESKLKDCKIKLNVSNTILGRARKTENDGTEVITLYNSSDVHFQYFSFLMPKKAGRRTRKRN